MGWINEQEATALAFVVLTVTLYSVMALGAKRVPTESTCCLLSAVVWATEMLRLVGCELKQ